MTYGWDIRARVQFEGDAHVIEDSCGFNGPNAWIIDGATSLLEPLVLPAASNPQWLAQELTQVLGAGAPDPARQGVRAVLAGALAAIDAAGTELVGAEKVRFPSAAISVAQLNAGGVEIASLADCTVVVRMHDGATHLVRAGDADAGVPLVEPVELVPPAPLVEPFEATASKSQELPTRRDLLIRDRELRNTPGRLWVARREPEAADHAHVVQLGQPELMVMASDGAWRAVDLGIVSGPEEFLARTATTVDALGLMHELRVRQAEIGEIADDATILALAPRPRR
ncbi:MULTISPECIES: hypothetical protein [Arthrobacter]|uniref:hypothetical protein n=1 Tax=Arthrobacter TaxID=1663 RepID=UPI000536129B|nr:MULTISPECIES: hypothetical protein [Arthrobacter]AIY03755.1 hypothetical protein ART_4156 [Arthrobacter sp. PAMC 25486]